MKDEELKYKKLITNTWVRIKTFEEFGMKQPGHFAPEMAACYGKFVQIKRVDMKLKGFEAENGDNPSLGGYLFSFNDVAEDWSNHLSMFKVISKMKKEIGL